MHPATSLEGAGPHGRLVAEKNWRPEIQQLIRRKLFGSKLPTEILEYQLDLLLGTKFATTLIDPGLSRPQRLRISARFGRCSTRSFNCPRQGRRFDSRFRPLALLKRWQWKTLQIQHRRSIAMNIHELYRRVRYCAIPPYLGN